MLGLLQWGQGVEMLLSRSSVAGLVLTLIIVLSHPAANAQGPFLSEGKWDISVWAAGATGEETSNSFAQAQISTVGVFVGRFVTGELAGGWRRGRLEYGINLVPVLVQSRIQTEYGGGFEPVVLRWTSSHRLGRGAPYIELSGGGVFTSANLPPGRNTSPFNFTARGGGGILIFTNGRRSLDIGCHWMHASNANLASFNPEFNGVQISFGYHWLK
jgi:hypothetical protein